jgi:hypothetical protein
LGFPRILGQVVAEAGERMETTIESRVVRKAAEVVGEEELAARLGLNVRTVRLLMSGKLPVPKRLFLLAIDIITGEDLPLNPETPAGERRPRAGN